MSNCPFKAFLASFQSPKKEQGKGQGCNPTPTLAPDFIVSTNQALVQCPFTHNKYVQSGIQRAASFFSGSWNSKNNVQNSDHQQTGGGITDVVPYTSSEIVQHAQLGNPKRVAVEKESISKVSVGEQIVSSKVPTETNLSVKPTVTIKVHLNKRKISENVGVSGFSMTNSSFLGLVYGSKFASLSLSGWGSFIRMGAKKNIRKRVKGKGKSQSKGQSKGKFTGKSNSRVSQPIGAALGPLAGLFLNKSGQLTCPAPIVAMRAALSKTTFIKQLRPRSMPVKLATIGGIGVVANIPCGMVREHYKKFSAGWFVAVHATIPFVAMLRKAAILPKYSLGVTILAAIIG